ncbi:MAG: type 2 lanthipeptide synthetase LanM family protein, partial [Planctomycetota bacterium]
HTPPSASWCQALNLAERLELLPCCPGTRPADRAATARLQRWRSVAAFPSEACFERRLQADRLALDEFSQLFAEPSESLQQRVLTLPAWVALLEAAFAPASAERITMPPAAGAGGLFDWIEPLVRRGQERLAQRAADIERQFGRALCDAAGRAALLAPPRAELWWMINRTLVLELNVARLQDALPGETPEQRFDAFAQELRQPPMALRLLEEYPVLARLVVEAIDRWVDFRSEVLLHLASDLAELRAAFSPECDLGLVTRIDGGAGDTHRGGRSVQFVEFSSGLKLVYKPRSLAVDVHFQELLAWLNARGDHPPFRILKVLDRDTHGWVEFVPASACTTAAQVRRFYERQGGYLAVLYALEATDFHAENLIAAGEHPVLVDLESLFQTRPSAPDTSEATRKLGEAFSYSVLRIGLLPERMDGVEVSGLGAGPGQVIPRALPAFEQAGTDTMRLIRKSMELPESQNRPRLLGVEIDVLDQAGAIIDGFTRVYALLLEHRSELLALDGPLARFAGDEVRIILRPTEIYGELLQEGFHPSLLRNALERDQLFDRLWHSVDEMPYLATVIPFERRDLWQGDVPMFTTKVDSVDLLSAAGDRVAGFFAVSGLDAVRQRIQQMDEKDLDRQLWFVRASLTVLSRGINHIAPATQVLAMNGPLAAPAEYLAAARTIGERLDTLALRGSGEAQWIGLTLHDQKNWSLAPLGIDLYGGLPGLALFLAYLGDRTHDAGFTRLAREALVTMRQQVATYRHELPSIGAFDGWGGVVYVLSHLGRLWREPALFAEAAALVDVIGSLLPAVNQFDIVSGAAGAIGCLASLQRVHPAAKTLAIARACGEWLIEHARKMPSGCGWSEDPQDPPLTGFTHGGSGVAWALLELAQWTREHRFLAAARDAIAYEQSLFSGAEQNWPDLRVRAGKTRASVLADPTYMMAWCHGAPGIGLARLRALQLSPDRDQRDQAVIALESTLRDGFGGNHSLCHGDLGNLDLLIQAGLLLGEGRWRDETSRVASALLAAGRERGWLCGTPLDVESPGFMLGLAGIGYQLLRLSQPENVPSVLLLEPPR